jgi:alpha-N-arabinofuranosidase
MQLSAPIASIVGVALAATGTLTPVTAESGHPGRYDVGSRADGARPSAAGASPRAVVRINTRDLGGRVSRLLAGSNHRYARHGYGIWNPRSETPDATAVANAKEAGIAMLRYPGGSRANLFDWKEAIGEPAERGCQVNGKWGKGSLRADYGVDEHMLTARRIGARTHITVPFATETPSDAAAWVEYMNARVGQDPDGDGVDMARLRESNQRRLGEPTRPYDIDFWTIGNEPYLKHERFWMSENPTKALQQYIRGGRDSYDNQLVGSRCERSRSSSSGTGEAGQRFEVLYPPIVADSQRIAVNGRRWREVADLTRVDRGARVYTIDDNSGHIHFGGGTTDSGAVLGGRAPRDGAPVRADYTGTHKGYVHFARAMHEVDRSIDVCSEWGHVAFVEAMSRQHRRYDCLAGHPYNFMNREWDDPRQGHDDHMLGLAESSFKLHNVQRRLRQATNGRSHLVVTEYGALSTVAQPKYRRWHASMTDALFQISSLAMIINASVDFAEGGALTSNGLRGWLGERPEFVISAAARGLQATSSMISGGGRTVRFSSDSPRQRLAGGRSYPTLGTSVTKDREGALNLLLVNRDRDDPMKVLVRNPYFTGRSRAATWRVTSRSIASSNTAENPNAVMMTRDQRPLPSARRFAVGLPAHSILRLRLPPRR